MNEIKPAEWLALNQFLLELKKVDSRTISVFYPYGKGKAAVTLLQKTHRSAELEKIESAIEDKIKSLQKNPSSAGRFAKTLCVFGWIKSGKVHVKSVGTSQKLPFLYMVSKKPYTKPFRDLLKTNRDVTVIVLDQKTAKISKFHGNQIIAKSKLSLDLQGRHRKGGQSQGRFLRARQTKIYVFFKKVAAKLKTVGDVELILLGGPGTAKKEFVDVLDSKTAGKCKIADLSFADSDHVVYGKIISSLYGYRRAKIARLLKQYQRLVKSGLTAHRNDVILRALKISAVDTLIVSAEYHADVQFGKILKILELAESTSAKIEFVVNPAIIEKLKNYGSVLAILRYKIN